MTAQIANFHHAFSQALNDPDADASPLLKEGVNAGQRRFNIYRNNRVVSLIDALRQSYPAIERLVGVDFFKASARAFIDNHPPKQPVLSEYGQEFGAFLGKLPNTSKLPFLTDVAAIEWWRLQAYHSADVPVLQAAALSAVPPEAIMTMELQCHPAVHWVQSKWPVGSIWTNSVVSPESSMQAQTVEMSQAQSVLITRPELDVQVNIIQSEAIVFLQAIREGLNLAGAAAVAIEADSTFDTGANLVGLTNLGAFSYIKNIEAEQDND